MNKYNHELSDYNFNETVAFESIMPAVLTKLNTIGKSDVVIESHGHLANGMDSLEVVDIESIF